MYYAYKDIKGLVLHTLRNYVPIKPVSDIRI